MRFVIIILLIVLAAVAFFYWQQHKNAIIEKSIKNVVSKKTGSLYYIKYDSTAVDVIKG